MLGNNKPATAPAPTAMRAARAPLPTLGDLEGATATATLRPPGAVPPPPRALPLPTPSLDAAGLDRDSALETPLPLGAGGDAPFTTLAGDLPPSPRTPQPRVEPARAEPVRHFESATVAQRRRASAVSNQARDGSVARLDAGHGQHGVEKGHASRADRARRVFPTSARAAVGAQRAGARACSSLMSRSSAGPKQSSLVTVRRDSLSRMRIGVLVLGGLLLMAAGALVVMIFRRTEASANRSALPSASAAPAPPGCTLTPPPTRLSTIERSVPISALPQDDGSIALGIADTKNSVAGWIYDPVLGEPKRKLDAQAGTSDVSHVTASDPLLVDRASPDFSFGQTLAPGLSLGVGPNGLLRRGDDGATGTVWPLPAGVRVTPPRVVTFASGHFVAFRQGGAEGQIMAGWIRPDGSAAAQASAIEGAPKSLGTPNVAAFGQQALVMFSARADKSEPYRIFVATAAPGKLATPRARSSYRPRVAAPSRLR